MAHMSMDKAIQLWNSPNSFPNQRYTFNEILSLTENVRAVMNCGVITLLPGLIFI